MTPFSSGFMLENVRKSVPSGSVCSVQRLHLASLRDFLLLQEHRGTTFNGWEARSPVQGSWRASFIIISLSKHGYGKESAAETRSSRGVIDRGCCIWLASIKEC